MASSLASNAVIRPMPKLSHHNEVTLVGRHARLEPLGSRHVAGLAAASGTDGLLYQWSPAPQTRIKTARYIQTAVARQKAGTAVPFAIVSPRDGVTLGSTRFSNFERWSWPNDHARYGRAFPDACEIGYTWWCASALQTVVFTEAKLLMLSYAFETWQVLRVCFHTDPRDERSRTALERLGGSYEGILRAHRLAADCTPRESVRYSILDSEWPKVKLRLKQMLNR
jgi:N-acetyltransferase